MSSFLRTLLLGLVFFFLGVLLVFLGVAGGRQGFLGAGIGSLSLSVVVLAVGAWLSRKRPDPRNRRREERLWKSGPLGRRWLQDRRRMP